MDSRRLARLLCTALLTLCVAPATASAGLSWEPLHVGRGIDVFAAVQNGGSQSAEDDLEGPGPWTSTVNASVGTPPELGGTESHATASQTSDVTLIPDRFAFSIASSLQLSTTGTVFGMDRAHANTYASASFDSDVGLSYTLTGSMSDANSVPEFPNDDGHTTVTLTDEDSGAPIFVIDSDQSTAVARTGTLPPGEYSLAVSGFASTNPGNPSVNAGHDLDFEATPTVCPASMSAPIEEISVADETCPPDDPPPDDGVPTVVIDQAPSGADNPPDGEIRFHSTEPEGATFRCKLDAQPEADCASPYAFQGLAPGEHTFTVTTKDAAGNTSAPASRTWTVRTPAPCEIVVAIGFAKACGSTLQETEPGSRIYKTSDVAWVGGFEIRPRAGGKLVVDKGATQLREEGAGVDVVFAGRTMPLPLSRIPIGSASASVEFGGAGSAEHVFFDLPLEVEAKTTWADGGSSAELEFALKVDKLTETLGAVLTPEVGDFEGELKAKLENGRGFRLDSAKVQVAEVSFLPGALMIPQAVKLKDLVATYELRNGKDFWTGQGLLELPIPHSRWSVGGKFSIYDGSFAGAGIKVDGFNRPIGTSGLFLQSIEGELLFRPSFGFDLGIGGSFGPRIGDAELATFTGNLRALALAAGCTAGQDPVQAAVTGKVPAMDNVGELEFEAKLCFYASSPVTDVAMKVETSFGPDGETEELFGFEGTLTGAANNTQFNIEGGVEVKVPGFDDISGNAVISTVGVAACAQLVTWFDGGFGYTWGGGPPALFSGCDLRPWKATVASPRATASASVTVPAGLPLVGLRAEGKRAAPRVRVIGPGGERFVSPRRGAIRTKRVVIVPAAREKRTYVIVRSPSAGQWRIKSLERGNPVVRVGSARGLTDPSVRARVVRPRKRTGKHTLTYRIKRLPGQRVVFTERAAGLARRLTTTKKARGRVRFRPRPSTQRKRTIEALVIQDGLPRATLTVARYKAPAPARPAAPANLRASRNGAAVTVTFAKVTGAREYLVEARQGEIVVASTLTPTPSASLSGLPVGPLTVSVRAIVPYAPAGRVAQVPVP